MAGLTSQLSTTDHCHSLCGCCLTSWGKSLSESEVSASLPSWLKVSAELWSCSGKSSSFFYLVNFVLPVWLDLSCPSNLEVSPLHFLIIMCFSPSWVFIGFLGCNLVCIFHSQVFNVLLHLWPIKSLPKKTECSFRALSSTGCCQYKPWVTRHGTSSHGIAHKQPISGLRIPAFRSGDGS